MPSCIGKIVSSEKLAKLDVCAIEYPDRWMFYRNGEWILLIDKNTSIAVLETCIQEIFFKGEP